MHLSEIWHSKQNDSRLSRTQVNWIFYELEPQYDFVKGNYRFSHGNLLLLHQN